MGFYLIGYSGHAFVVVESALESGLSPLGYFERSEKASNPYQRNYMGSENDADMNDPAMKNSLFFIGIGDNKLRRLVSEKMSGAGFINVIDKTAAVSKTARLQEGVYVGKGAHINALSSIGRGVILNTGS